MRKLLKLKEWLTVPDAARHLSILFEEEVAEADVLRLALDGHLTLSVLFVNHTHARCGSIVPLERAKFSDRRTPGGFDDRRALPAHDPADRRRRCEHRNDTAHRPRDASRGSARAAVSARSARSATEFHHAGDGWQWRRSATSGRLLLLAHPNVGYPTRGASPFGGWTSSVRSGTILISRTAASGRRVTTTGSVRRRGGPPQRHTTAR